jgi:phosphatidylserine/phosphatidylglycerophosphate/cardiolipin synthase-like enzyme
MPKAKAPTKSPNNAVGDPTQSLQTFNLLDLQQFTREKTYASNASKDLHLFFVGRDDVHELLKYVLSRVSVSLYLNMFGYDDDELNDILMAKVMDPSITVLITLDRSQSTTKTEAALIAADKAQSLTGFNTHFVIGESATHQISHTKGFVADGKVAAEGSTNWSTSGEGKDVQPGGPGGPGYVAQNNTQTIIIDPDTIGRFTAELISEHIAAQHAALSDPNAVSSLKTQIKGASKAAKA